MRKFIGLGLLLGMFAVSAFAQEMATAPKAEIFGGYQYTRFDGGTNANGWNGAVTGNLNNWFGIAGDFSVAYTSLYGVSFNNYTYNLAQMFSYRHNSYITPLVQLL